MDEQSPKISDQDRGKKFKEIFETLNKCKKRLDKLKITRSLTSSEEIQLTEVNKKLDAFTVKCRMFIKPRKNGPGKFMVEEYVKWCSYQISDPGKMPSPGQRHNPPPAISEIQGDQNQHYSMMSSKMYHPGQRTRQEAEGMFRNQINGNTVIKGVKRHPFIYNEQMGQMDPRKAVDYSMDTTPKEYHNQMMRQRSPSGWPHSYSMQEQFPEYRGDGRMVPIEPLSRGTPFGLNNQSINSYQFNSYELPPRSPIIVARRKNQSPPIEQPRSRPSPFIGGNRGYPSYEMPEYSAEFRHPNSYGSSYGNGAAYRNETEQQPRHESLNTVFKNEGEYSTGDDPRAMATHHPNCSSVQYPPRGVPPYSMDYRPPVESTSPSTIPKQEAKFYRNSLDEISKIKRKKLSDIDKDNATKNKKMQDAFLCHLDSVMHKTMMTVSEAAKCNPEKNIKLTDIIQGFNNSVSESDTISIPHDSEPQISKDFSYHSKRVNLLEDDKLFDGSFFF